MPRQARIDAPGAFHHIIVLLKNLVDQYNKMLIEINIHANTG